MAECDEIVVSNVLYQRLPHTAQRGFRELEPIAARNVGRLNVFT
jgi:hypothetical protein